MQEVLLQQLLRVGFYLLQAGRADVQDTAYVSTGVSQSAHQGTERHSVTAVIGCSVSRCAVQTH